MRKINIGAGKNWRREGWESLDSAPGGGLAATASKGLCWHTGLPDKAFDTVFTCHMLEHVPHFRLEMTIAEFNRIMVTGGTLRIVVPDLRRAVAAYLKGDKSFFKYSAHYSDHMGIGGSLLSLVISPGKQTLAVSPGMDEIFGRYAHLYAFDFDMLRAVLDKWGFCEIRECGYRESSHQDMCEPAGIRCDGKFYSLDDRFVTSKSIFQSDKSWHHTGFDKMPEISLIVEATKLRDESYAFEKEYTYNQRGRISGPRWAAKLFVMRAVVKSVDFAFDLAKRLLRR